MIIWAIAKTTIGDALRKKVLQIFLVVAVGLIIISLSFSQTLSFSNRAGASTDLMLIKSFGMGLMAIAGMFISLVMGVSLIPQEIERRTIYTILSKPVNRYEFIIGKFLGAIITLAINIAIMGVVFVLVIVFKAVSIDQTTAPIDRDLGAAINSVGIFDINTVWTVVLIFLQFMVLSSVVLFLSTFLSPTVNFFVGAGTYILGMLTPMMRSIASTKAGETPTLIERFYGLLGSGLIIPDFDKFNKPNALLHPESVATLNIGKFTLIAAIIAIIYVLIMMVLSVLVFWKKEV